MRNAAPIVGVFAAGAMAAPWPFFAFDNGVGRGQWTPEQQAAVLKDVGYDGIGYNHTNNDDLRRRQAAFRAAGLKIFSLYLHTFPDQKPGWPPSLRETVELLRGTETRLWITFRRPAVGGNYDEACVRIAREIGDLAAAAGVRVAIYPHAGFYVETSEDALRIARAAAHPSVGPSYNLCHEFLAGRGVGALTALAAVAPSAELVSINGVDPSDRRRFILPLGEGSFDVGALLAALHRAGYRGPVGHQCFGVAGDPTANLRRAMDAWRRLTSDLPPAPEPGGRHD